MQQISVCIQVHVPHLMWQAQAIRSRQEVRKAEAAWHTLQSKYMQSCRLCTLPWNTSNYPFAGASAEQMQAVHAQRQFIHGRNSASASDTDDPNQITFPCWPTNMTTKYVAPVACRQLESEAWKRFCFMQTMITLPSHVHQPSHTGYRMHACLHCLHFVVQCAVQRTCIIILRW